MNNLIEFAYEMIEKAETIEDIRYWEGFKAGVIAQERKTPYFEFLDNRQ